MSERLPGTVAFQPASGEAEFAAFLEQHGMIYKYEQRSFEIVVCGRPYSFKPDFYLKSLGIYVEIVNPRGKGRLRRIRFKKAKAHAVHRQYGKAVMVIPWDPNNPPQRSWKSFVKYAELLKVSAQREHRKWLRKNRP